MTIQLPYDVEIEFRRAALHKYRNKKSKTFTMRHRSHKRMVRKTNKIKSY
jgi:hypothetical protein